ncbi:MAG: response regulator [Clostridia bacterium]|nr:response regulator [Clostridia bacterium]
MYKLLLVDDEQIIREGIEKMVDWAGLHIVLTASCSNAIAALDSMTDNLPDILLTDIRMPGMDGLELAERAAALHPMLQTIILSGYDTFEYAQQAVKRGVQEYLLKPCSQSELTEAIRRACRAVDRRRQHVLYLSGERSERVRTLVAAFESLLKAPLDAQQLEHQVHELSKTAEDPSLLREALICVVTGNMGSGQTEWSMNVIMDAMRMRESLEPLISRTLIRLRGEGSPPPVAAILSSR